MNAITSAQSRAARGLLGWSQTDLAERAGLGVMVISNFESGRRSARKASLESLQEVFERAGVILDMDGRGVRLAKL